MLEITQLKTKCTYTEYKQDKMSAASILTLSCYCGRQELGLTDISSATVYLLKMMTCMTDTFYEWQIR